MSSSYNIKQHMMTLWRTIWLLPIKLNIHLPYDPAIPLWVISPKETQKVCPQIELYKNVHRSLIIRAPNRKEFKCPSTGEWINKLVYLDDGILFSNKKEWTTDIRKIWINITDILLSERSQTQKAHIHTVWSHLYEVLDQPDYLQW